MVRQYDSHQHVGPGQTAWSDRGMGEGWSFTYSDELVPSQFERPADQRSVGTLFGSPTRGVELKFTPNGSGGYTTPPHDLRHSGLPMAGTGYLWTDTTGDTVHVRLDSGRLVSESRPLRRRRADLLQ